MTQITQGFLFQQDCIHQAAVACLVVAALAPLLLQEIEEGATPLEALTRTMDDRRDACLVRGRRLQMAEYMREMPPVTRDALEANVRVQGYTDLENYIAANITKKGAYVLGESLHLAALAFGHAYSLLTPGTSAGPLHIQQFACDPADMSFEGETFALILAGQHIDVLISNPVGRRDLRPSNPLEPSLTLPPLLLLSRPPPWPGHAPCCPRHSCIPPDRPSIGGSPRRSAPHWDSGPAPTTYQLHRRRPLYSSFRCRCHDFAGDVTNTDPS